MFKKSKFIVAAALLAICFPLAPLSAASGINFEREPLAFTVEPVLNISENSENFRIPWEWEPLTPAYEYSFITEGLYDPSRPLKVKINYPEKNNELKQIFSFDFISSVWRPVPTQDYPQEQYVTMTTDATSGWLIVLAKPEVMTVGQASWYKYKEGLFAASPDFIKGTKLRVYNTDNGKFVDVTVNDYGPDRSLFPTRVIDLDRVAFEKIASLSAGIANVRVEVLKAETSPTSVAPQITDVPSITASSSIIMMEDSGEVLWGKNQVDKAPLASLTKLVAMTTFLNTKPTLSSVVTYKKQDENYNYEYCKPWESARLRVDEGETMTVENLLYSALVGSANNAVETLVRASGLKRVDFIANMNKLAKDWGATNTKFVEPTGLSPDNVSSPFDYAIMVKEIFKNPLIQKISITKTYSFVTINTKEKHTLTNTDKLLNNTAYNILGSKTGYLDEAGYCLMTRVKTDAGNMIVINFGSKSKAANFADNEQLIRYGLKVVSAKK
ncbi:MAG TPA: RlpA-like double-psi beta-barrel domain-containing protein [Candidatus Saccharimonadales bacterium]|nr:RlpA-like double-psi beta-barrel domain-containing protein [Candidatus Saccharimonadales bacterium]